MEKLKTKSGKFIGQHELLYTVTWDAIDDAIRETFSDARLPVFAGVFRTTDPDPCTTQMMCIALALNEYSL
jgi:hypothetical protein